MAAALISVAPGVRAAAGRRSPGPRALRLAAVSAGRVRGRVAVGRVGLTVRADAFSVASSRATALRLRVVLVATGATGALCELSKLSKVVVSAVGAFLRSIPAPGVAVRSSLGSSYGVATAMNTGSFKNG
ncbi:MAG: hypothetical protein E6G27_09330 [Actinobacteria bacterium]|nr:MAG: hypothetical protein E6G27_09330 [Actinomycetota bacterium]